MMDGYENDKKTSGTTNSVSASKLKYYLLIQIQRRDN